MNKRTIEITVSPIGEVFIEAVGYRGSSCESATKHLEEALGVVASKVKKPEYHQQNVNTSRQRVGE